MRYHETRERSAELLRLALSSIGQHEAAINPVTYTVWYEHVAGINVPLSNDLGELLQNDKDLDDCAIDHLYTQHIAPADTEALQIITGSIHNERPWRIIAFLRRHGEQFVSGQHDHDRAERQRRR